LIWLLQFLKGWVFFGAYNKAIAMEIKDKVSKLDINTRQIDAGTIHSAGFKAIMKLFPKTKVNAKKVWDIIDEMSEESDTMAKTLELCDSFIAKSVSIAKQRAFGFLCSVDDQSKWYDLVDHFGLEEELPEDGISLDTALELTVRAFKRSIELDPLAIDFDDMILSPLIHKANLFKRDWVLIDEAQDTNPARRALAMAMMQPKTGRLIAVGDPAQAIYGFTGADSNSMNLIKDQLNSKELPLNLTYRCPKAIVRRAQKLVPDIEAHESAPEGLDITIALGAPKVVGVEDQCDTFWGKYAKGLSSDDVILCRGHPAHSGRHCRGRNSVDRPRPGRADRVPALQNRG
jgi:superfamily I DNA/RNA helicase